MKNIFKFLPAFYFFCFCCFPMLSFSQTEVEPWGNITGIRINGQLMEFESSLNAINKNWSSVKATAKEKQRPKYERNGNQQIISTNLDSLYFTELLEDASTGVTNVKINITPKADMSLEGIFFELSLPNEYYADGNIQVNNLKAVKLAEQPALINKYLQVPANSLRLGSADRQLMLTFDKPTVIIIKKGKGIVKEVAKIFVALQTGDVQLGQTISKTFSIKASGRVDISPVTITLNTSTAGRSFDGLGGNFRLQNPKTDPQVIDYCLENLRVSWGRVEMPWRFWQPAIDTNPTMEAKAGRLHPLVQKSMEMAQRLYKLGMPVILTSWSAPSWAIIGAPKFRPGTDGVWGNPLDKTKTGEIYKSIADYIFYLKDQYGVEVSMFSFNESDLGINIRQTGEEHAELIKGLGAYFVSRGLKTKMLLGDNSDATTYEFIYPAMNDPATHPYIGAISFHSWRGWETETLKKWADAATKLHLPLLVGEGSVDAAAWAYPAIFEEQIYSLKEINLYTRLLAICQPASILQWQLTADYSPMAGGGIFGNNEPLRPLQRFYNLKQLSSTPKGLKAMPIQSGSKDITSAALGDNDRGVYAIHLVNNGASRDVTITGIPGAVKSFRLLVTDKKQSMKETPVIKVVKGNVKFHLEATSYTTLISN